MIRLAGLHVILDCSRAMEFAPIAEEEGAAVVQLRDKHVSDDDLLQVAQELRRILIDTVFIVNDRVDIAVAVGADGVHLGQADMPIVEARSLLGSEAIIGLSTSGVSEAISAEQAGANYIGFGHMFSTRSKQKPTAPRTAQELEAVVASVSIPVIAIGGITESNLPNICVMGLGGIAVISAIGESKSPRATIGNFVRFLEKHHATYA